MENEIYFERIHDYLSGSLSSAEKEIFENEMARNPILKQDVILEKELLNIIQMASDKELREEIEKAQNHAAEEGMLEAPKPNIKWAAVLRVLALAGTVAILLLTGWWFFDRNHSVNPEKIFSDNFRAEKIQVKSIISDMETYGFADSLDEKNLLRQSLLRYDSGEYQLAILELNTFLKIYPENDTARFYLSMSYLNDSQYARAVEKLVPLSEKKDFPMHQDAKWYLALAYLKVENGVEKSKALFSDLASDATYAGRQGARGILQILK